MHGCDFAGVRLHPPGSLSRFDVAPDHRCHVTFVVHEARVEIRCLVRIGGDDVGLTTGEGVCKEMEHGEEFASMRHWMRLVFKDRGNGMFLLLSRWSPNQPAMTL